MLFWSFLICGFTTTGVIETHLLPFASWCGFAPVPSATAYSFLSAVNLVGMIVAGWLTDRMNRPLLLASIYLIRGMTFLFLANLPGTSIETLFVFAALFGAVDYSTVPVTASLVASHVGVRVMGLAMGLIAAGHAVGGCVEPGAEEFHSSTHERVSVLCREINSQGRATRRDGRWEELRRGHSWRRRGWFDVCYCGRPTRSSRRRTGGFEPDRQKDPHVGRWSL